MSIRKPARCLFLVCFLLSGMVVPMNLHAGEARIESHSFARPQQVRTTHLDLDLRVDFDAQRLHGSATLDLERAAGATTLVLDTWKLDIDAVTLLPGDHAAEFTLGDEVDALGRPLLVPLRDDTRSVRVRYRTTAGARALQWLTREQTRDKTQPFLYTQSQSINARSWVPCQDVPSVRFTYAARVQVPAGMLAIMSARNVFEKTPDGVYSFDMPQPIPAYLLALAAGDIAFQSISQRCGVFAEPSMVEKAAWEFADVERMTQVAESLYGPYRWERFDAIVLPPSFPFGGMENPRVTFLTPTLIAGDRSLVSTVAHELAHSWSGNLVTNAAWEDFWLNEGFTTYFEQRIMEELYGRDVAEMHALLGLDNLRAAIERSKDEPGHTALYVELDQDDPDGSLGTAAYQKGYLFLRMLEESVGRAAWDPFLRSWFDEHAFQSMTTKDFLAYLQAQLFDGDASELDKRRVAEWVYEGGLPDNAPRPHTPLFERADTQVRAWDQGKPARELETEGWSTQEWDYFLTHIGKDMPGARMAELDEAFAFDESNGMLQRSWYQLVIHNQWGPGYASLEAFLLHVGRRWLVRPLYASLARTETGLAWARQVYARARPGYHPITAHSVDETLSWEAGE